jgi:cellulose synthase/poly-beta-1,6-N-acetylglucosamine synthase-like glycosyltransferase
VSPRVSVIVAAHEAEGTVGAAVESVLWQSYRDRELIVVDDGSTDRTADIVTAHPGVRLIRQENAGVAAARNHGLRKAAGELVTFLDADDLLFEDHLAVLVRTYERTGGIVTPNSFWLLPGGIHPDRKRYRGGFPKPERQRRAILEQNFVSIMSLWPRRMADEIGPLSEELLRAEDWEFWIRAIYRGYRVALQPRPLSLYRWGATGLSAAWGRMDEAVAAVLRRAEERLPLDPEERAYVRRRLEGPDPKELSRLGDRALRQRRYTEAARHYRRAAALNATERRLVWKARLMSAAPPLAGPIVRARQLRIERHLGIRDEHVR